MIYPYGYICINCICCTGKQKKGIEMIDEINKIKKSELLYPPSVARMLDVSLDTVYRLIRNGELEAIKTSLRKTRIPKLSLDEYLKKLNPYYISPEAA